MPLKIKLPVPVATANIALTNLAELAKEEATRNAPSQFSGRNDANNFEASGFPLPPLPHQGRNHADFTADAAARHELTATDNFSNEERNHNSHEGFLPPNNKPMPPSHLPTEFNFSESNNHAAAGHYNAPVPHWQQHHQTQQQTVVNNPIKISDQAGYKDFLPPPIHVPKNIEKGSGTAANNNDGSAGVPPIKDGHDSSSNMDQKESSNHGIDDQQQQHPLLPPLPQERVENTSEKETESEVLLENSKRDLAAPSDSTETHQNQRDAVTIYAYSTLHQQKSWNEMVELFTKFNEVNGHANVEMENVKISVDGYNQSDGDCDNEKKELLLMLRSWVRELRYTRNANDSGVESTSKKRSTKQQQQQRCDSETLTSERISQLNELSFPWKNNLTQWQKWLDDLMHYRAKNNGDCNVPVKFLEHPPLGNFVNRQRVEYKKMRQGKSSTMSSTKMQDLDRIGFVWSVREGGHTSWDDRLAELVAYQREQGNTLVPKKYPQNPPLGYWVNEQRFQYQRHINGKSSTINKKRQDSLNSINFKWSVRESPREFSEWIKLLKEYKSQWGNCNVPLKYEQDVSLGAFVNNARTQYKKFQSGLPSNMTQEKIDRLEGIGFVWNVREGRTPWSRRFEELKEYKEKYGDCNVPKKWTENQKLSTWVTKQRGQYKLHCAGKVCNLTEEKVDKLTELGLFQTGETMNNI
eukprot:scaffold37727_cov103-Skeletonema_marinoi.AAC.4